MKKRPTEGTAESGTSHLSEALKAFESSEIERAKVEALLSQAASMIRIANLLHEIVMDQKATHAALGTGKVAQRVLAIVHQADGM